MAVRDAPHREGDRSQYEEGGTADQQGLPGAPPGGVLRVDAPAVLLPDTPPQGRAAGHYFHGDGGAGAGCAPDEGRREKGC